MNSLDIAADLKTGSKLEKDIVGTRIRKIKPFRLQDAVCQLTPKERNHMLLSSYKRILIADSKSAFANTTFSKLAVGTLEKGLKYAQS